MTDDRADRLVDPEPADLRLAAPGGVDLPRAGLILLVLVLAGCGLDQPFPLECSPDPCTTLEPLDR